MSSISKNNTSTVGRADVLGISSLAIGVAALITWLIPFYGLPVPTIGLVLGIVAIRRKVVGRKKAISGIILCSIGLFLAVGYSIISTFIYNPTDTVTPAGPLSEWTADGVISPDEYATVEFYGDNHEYELHWKRDAQYIYIALKAETSGWVAVGFQPPPNSEGNADMILGSVQQGVTTIYDLVSTDETGSYYEDIELGGTNNVTEFGGAEEEGHTIIEFKRRIDTGDYYDQPLYEGVNIIMWAYCSDDNRDSQPDNSGLGYLELVHQGEGVQTED